MGFEIWKPEKLVIKFVWPNAETLTSIEIALSCQLVSAEFKFGNLYPIGQSYTCMYYTAATYTRKWQYVTPLVIKLHNSPHNWRAPALPAGMWYACQVQS